MITRVVKHNTTYLHTCPVREATVKYLPVRVQSVSLAHCKSSGKPCTHTELCSRNCPIPPCIWYVLIVLFWTAVLTVHSDCNTEQRERGREWWVVNELSLAFFSLMWLQHRARFEHSIVRQRVLVHIQILCSNLCAYILICRHV